MRDADVREALMRHLEDRLSRDRESLVVQEFGLLKGLARVDVAVVNGCLHGFEIKSDADDLERLPGQVEAYGRVLDRVTLVVGPRWRRAARRRVPRWWGLCLAARSATGSVTLSWMRRPQRNPSLDPVAVASLLWHDELLGLLESVGCADGMRSKPRGRLCERVAQDLPLGELREAVRERLRSRTSWRA